MLDLTVLKNFNRLLFSVPLRPVQGDRFQPTGFPSLGAATYQTKDGQQLLVESAQSMANRLEATCWDTAKNAPVAALSGISHVTVMRKGVFLTDSMLEAHRINSAYLLWGDNKTFLTLLKTSLGKIDVGAIDRKKLALVILKLDVGSLIHGVFLAKDDLAGGRLRVARALSAFVEAYGIRVVASGGVKNDHVHPGKVQKDPKNHFGNIPFARDEYTADKIICHINLDLAQIRGYGLGEKVEELLVLLSLHRVRRLLDGDLRLRTACDLEPIDRETIAATRPTDFFLPLLKDIETALATSITNCKDLMTHTMTTFDDPLNAGKDVDEQQNDGNDDIEADTDEPTEE
jgi:CRISPR-associated protein Csb1